MENSLQEKQKKLESALNEGVVMVYLDVHKPGVRLPSHLETRDYVALNLSYRFSPADLAVNAWGVRATLSFEGRPSPVAIPWSAIFAIRSHVTREFWLFPEDVPKAFLEMQETQKTQETLPPKPNKRATFQLIHSASTEATSDESHAAAEGNAQTKNNIKEAGEGEGEGEKPETSSKPKAAPTHLKLLN
jgi:stringent starvation protein B